MSAPLTPDIDALPFLVRNGGWFWIVLVVMLALLIVSVVAIIRRLNAVNALSWVGRFVGFGIALLASTLTLGIVGGVINAHIAKRDYRHADGRPLKLGELDMISIASSLPGAREKALDPAATSQPRAGRWKRPSGWLSGSTTRAWRTAFTSGPNTSPFAKAN